MPDGTDALYLKWPCRPTNQLLSKVVSKVISLCEHPYIKVVGLVIQVDSQRS